MKKSEFDALPENLQKKYWNAINISEDLWAWLCDNPTKDKTDYKKYKFARNTTCLLCEFHTNPYVKKLLFNSICEYCVLYNTCRDTLVSGRAFGNWYQNIQREKPDEQISFDNAFKIWEALFDEKLRIM